MADESLSESEMYAKGFAIGQEYARKHGTGNIALVALQKMRNAQSQIEWDGMFERRTPPFTESGLASIRWFWSIFLSKEHLKYAVNTNFVKGFSEGALEIINTTESEHASED